MAYMNRHTENGKQHAPASAVVSGGRLSRVAKAFRLFRPMARSEHGMSMVFFAVSLTVLALSAALVTDIGLLSIEKARLNHAVDAATLAAARAYVERPGTESLMAASYLEKNGFPEVTYDIQIDDSTKTLSLSAEKPVPYGFARLIGIEGGMARASATGSVLPVMGVNSGIRPFAIADIPLVIGAEYTLKEGGGDGLTGNYGAIELGGAGAKTYLNNIVEGFDGRLMVGDQIDTEPGNMSGPTETGVTTLLEDCTHNPHCTPESFEPDCPRLITIVIVDSLDVNGRSTVTITGFASFFLTGVDGSGKDSVVHGTFVRSVTSGETSADQEDYGLYGVRLIE
jgi:hypothetical protein